MISNIKVSIVCITYNHINYIEDAINSFLSQKAKFLFEVLIHDDASHDGTADIIKKYASKYPEIIKPVFQTVNQWSLGKSVAKTFLWPRIHGKYVAYCEGDDYWTDPYKLQKQVDALDAHPEASVCFHPVTVHWEDGTCPDSVFPSPEYRFNKNVLELSDLLKRNFIQTNSVMYRWRFHSDLFSLFPDDILPCDWFLHLLHAQMGKILFLPDNMGVYRKHKNSLWYECMKTARWFKNCGIKHYRFYEEAEKAFGADFSEEKKEMLLLCYAHALAQHDEAWLETLRSCYPIDESIFQHIRWKYGLLSVAMPFIYGRKREYAHRQKGNYKELLRIFSGQE